MDHSWTLVVVALYCSSAAAAFRVDCSEGCQQLPAAERSPNLLLIDDGQPEIVLTWTATSALDPRERFELRAGNPEVQDNLPSLGTLSFAAQQAGASATQRVRTADLGYGTFITVLLAQRGSTRSIADWRVFRIMRVSELAQRERDPVIASGFSVALLPVMLQVTSGHGELPHSTGGNERVWWPIPESNLNTVDVDIDGLNTGVAGLTITHSPPWEAEESTWQQAVLDHFDHVPLLEKHFVAFDQPWFAQSGDRTIDLGNGVEVLLKHYYSVVTMFTNASVSVYRAQDLGLGGNRRYFSHETTANFRQLAHPVLWSSYTRHEYSADRELLELVLQGMTRGGSGVPGLSHVQQDDGDGGSAIYSVGFSARVKPWKVPDEDGPQSFRAGFVHIDVVAARTGFGDIETHQEVGRKGLCQLPFMCKPGTKLDLSKPPNGYEVAAPVAVTGSQSGTLVMLQGTPLRAEKEATDEDGLDFPEKARFALAAQLRAGALVRKSGLFGGKIEDVVPINSYTQFAVKYTVGMIPGTVNVASDESILPTANQFDTSTLYVERPTWWQKLVGTIGWPLMAAAALAVLIIASFFFAPLGRLFSAIVGLFVAIINWLRDKFRR